MGHTNHMHTHTHICRNLNVLLTIGVLHESQSRHAHNYIINAIFSCPCESFWRFLLLFFVSYCLPSIQCLCAASLGEAFEGIHSLIN